MFYKSIHMVFISTIFSEIKNLRQTMQNTEISFLLSTHLKQFETIDIATDINMEIQFGERVGHGGWLIGPKLFRPKAYPACASSKLCEFIFPATDDKMRLQLTFSCLKVHLR